MKPRALFLLVALLLSAPLAADAQTSSPTCRMSVTPATINKGESVTLRWSSTNATSASIPGPGLGNVSPNDQRNLIPTVSTRWTGTFAGPGGNVTCSATVVVLNAGVPTGVTEPDSSVKAPDRFDGPEPLRDPPQYLAPAPTLPTAAPLQLNQSEGNGIVPCSGLDCEACHVAKLAQNIINFLIGLSIPLAAALFAWAGVLYFSSSVIDKLGKARRIFTSVLIGFALVVGAWLVVQTILSTVLKESYQNWNTIQCVGKNNRKMNATVQQLVGQIGVSLNATPNQNLIVQGTPAVGISQSSVYGCQNGWEYAPDSNQCINPNDRTQVVDATRTGANYFNATNGDINAAIALYTGADTSMGPDGGNKACAWAVNNILQAAGYAPLGNFVGVASAEAALLNGRGELQNQSTAGPGDIVIWGSGSHIGFCQNAGCTQVISNSSGQARFNLQTGFPAGSRIYRVTN